ncbi:putative phage abortive infection protein [Pseudomonas asplenii]|uniref:putative phage abortive infection protein n=1 Tax=Pseudomonas asplenii TaxID=53407 RepID=UPI00223476C7|nr:putative phage abortive infection protein [Pseudomonas asplenii]UZE31143.1 putative phage abortive infection protein [Pseudomonas asplenii]
MQEKVGSEAGPLDSTVIKLSAVILVIALACALSAILIYRRNFSGDYLIDHAAWGQFGDFFGGTLNPILAMLSLFAILGALVIQSRELSHSTSALREQSEYLNLQAFENTFFSMVHLYNENVKTLDLEDTEDKEEYSQGRGAFRLLLLRLEGNYESAKKYHSTGRDEREIISHAYKIFLADNDRFIGHYIGSLKSIIEFIEARRPSNREQYYSIVNAQLSANERTLVFYHSLNCNGFLELENLNKYDFFGGVPDQSLFNSELHISFIKKSN